MTDVYVRMHDGAVATTEPVNTVLNIDRDADGGILGFEILGAQRVDVDGLVIAADGRTNTIGLLGRSRQAVLDSLGEVVDACGGCCLDEAAFVEAIMGVLTGSSPVPETGDEQTASDQASHSEASTEEVLAALGDPKADKARRRIEWNPTGSIWLPGTAIMRSGGNVVVILDGSRQSLIVDPSHLRPRTDA